MTIIPLRYWLLLGLLFTSGCAEVPKYTQRTCIVGLIGQVGEGQILANLVCEKEEVFKPSE